MAKKMINKNSWTTNVYGGYVTSTLREPGVFVEIKEYHLSTGGSYNRYAESEFNDSYIAQFPRVFLSSMFGDRHFNTLENAQLESSKSLLKSLEQIITNL